MQHPPISQAQIEERIRGHEDELLQLWHAEQGGQVKDRDLQILASCIPFPRDDGLRVADLGCGPGDLGRAIWAQYPNAQIDFVDRDPLLLSICRGVNRQAGVPGTCRLLDLDDNWWCRDMQPRNYNVVAFANAIHWLSEGRAQSVLADTHKLLAEDGILLLTEPTIPEPLFAPGFDEWNARQPSRYEQRNWTAFWDTANALAGYDHTKLLGPREGDRIGDGMTVRGWIDLAEASSFRTVDVLWKGADEVIIAALKA